MRSQTKAMNTPNFSKTKRRRQRLKNEFIHTVLFFHMCNTRKTLVIKEGGKEDKYKYRKKKFIEAQRRNQEDTNRERA